MNATKFGSKNQILHTIIYHYMTSYGYVIMVIVDPYIIRFHLDLLISLIDEGLAYIVSVHTYELSRISKFMVSLVRPLLGPGPVQDDVWTALQCHQHLANNSEGNIHIHAYDEQFTSGGVGGISLFVKLVFKRFGAKGGLFNTMTTDDVLPV